MNRPRVILLAADQGSRLGDLTRDTHRTLLPIAGRPLLARTVRQMTAQGLEEITVVVGHRADRIKAALAGFSGITWVDNPAYATDANRGSLLLGLGRKPGPVLVIEGDVAMDDPAAAEIATAAKSGDSVWFTQGRFRPSQCGTIVRVRKDGGVADLRYASAYDDSFSQYRKTLGVLAIGTKQTPRFQRMLREGAASPGQFYLMPWVQHLPALPCSAFDLAHRRVATFTTPDDYRRCCELFAPAEAGATGSADGISIRAGEGGGARRAAWFAQLVQRRSPRGSRAAVAVADPEFR